jgi:hypothetical protein
VTFFIFVVVLGLPDGTFFKPKMPILVNLERLAMKDVCKFYGHFVYFTAIWCISWQCGIF